MVKSLLTEVVSVKEEHIGENQSQREDVDRSVDAEPAIGQALTVNSGEKFWRQKRQCTTNARDGFHDFNHF